MSRDGRFPAHQLMRRVNPRTQHADPGDDPDPRRSASSLMLVLPGDALIELITAGTILPVLIYGATVVLYLAVRKRLERKEGAFSPRAASSSRSRSSRWSGRPVALFVLVRPRGARTPVLIVVGLIVAGRLFFGLLCFNRESLETEPGDASVFEPH